VLEAPRVRRALEQITVPPPPKSKLELDAKLLKTAAEKSVQRATGLVREARERLARAEERLQKRGLTGGEPGAEDEDGGDAALGDPDGCAAQLKHASDMLSHAKEKLADVVGPDGAAAAAEAAAEKTAQKETEIGRKKRKQDERNEEKREALRAEVPHAKRPSPSTRMRLTPAIRWHTTLWWQPHPAYAQRCQAKAQDFQLEESYTLENGTVLKLELRTRTVGCHASNDYKGVTPFYEGITYAKHNGGTRSWGWTYDVAKNRGIKRLSNFETQVDAAKAPGPPTHEAPPPPTPD